jgi:hypothetical protein
METQNTFKIGILNHPLTAVAMLIVVFFIGFYFDISFIKGATLAGLLFLLIALPNNLKEEVISVELINGGNSLELRTVKYFVWNRKYSVNINDAKFNHHYYDKAFGKPLEIYLILNDGKVFSMTTKLWSKKKLIALSKNIFGVDVVKQPA